MTDTKIVITAADNTGAAFAAINGKLNSVKTGAQGLANGLSAVGSNLGVVAGVVGASLTASAFSGWIRGAINAADETSKLAQRIGVTTKDVAGLQLAFRQAGVGDAFATSMAKMSKSAADGGKAFEAMGINVKGSDGALKSSRQILGEVADKMASYQDGTSKAALAQEIFGKSGAELIPLLNAGAKGLDEYDAMAAKLGLTISEETAKEAEKFNDTLDLMGQGTQGVARQIAAQLLPTLSGLAGQFFDSMTSGDKLKKTADFLASSMKVLYISGLGVVEVFKTVGTTLGGVAAIIVSALSGDFKAAVSIFESLKTDIGTGWKETAAQMSAAWDAAGNSSVEAVASLSGAMKRAAPVIADMEKAGKAAAKALEDAAKAAKKHWDDLVKTINTNEQAKDKWLEQNDKTLEALIAGNESLRQQNEAIGLSTEATNALTLSRQDAAIAQAQLNLVDAQNIEGNEARVAQIEREIRLLQQRRELTSAGQRATAAAEAQKAAKDAAEKAAAAAASEWQKASDQINQSLTDALMDGFSAGKGFAKSFVDSVTAMFKTMVLRPVISAVVTGVTGSLGLSGTANAASSIGDMASNASSLVSLGSAMAGMGGMSVANVAGSMFANATGTGISGLLATNGAYGTAAGMAGAMGPVMQGLMTAAPYLAAVAAVYMIAKSIDKSGTPHTGGGSQYSAAGGLLDARSSTFASGFTGIKYSDSGTEFTAGITKSIVGMLDATASTFGKQAGYTAAASFADDTSKDGAWGSLRIADAVGNVLADWQENASFRTFSDGEAGSAEYLAAISSDVRTALNAIGVPDWAQKMLDSLGDAPSLEQLAAAVQTITAIEQAIVDQRAGLQQQLDLLTGVTTQREIERKALDESNRSLYDQVKALEDQKTAADAAAQAQQAAIKTVRSEIERLNGLSVKDSTAGRAYLLAQFTSTTAAARAGDVGALERLPELSQALESASALNAVTAIDLARTRAWLASSLEQTTGIRVPTTYAAVSAAAPSVYSPTSGDTAALESLIAALTAEVQSLKASARETSENTMKTNRILERVTPNGGDAIAVRAVA